MPHIPLFRSAFEDKRTELLHVDARDYLAKCEEQFDIIIIDLPDSIEEGPAYLLYTREFYQIARDRLTDNGIISVQAGSASINELLNLTAVNNTLKSVFPLSVVIYPLFWRPMGLLRRLNASQSISAFSR